METRDISVGPYYFLPGNHNVQMCVTSYVNLRPDTYEKDNKLDARTFTPFCDYYLPITVDFDPYSYFQSIKKQLKFVDIERITLSMVLNTVYLNGISHSNLPDCLRFDIFIEFDNSKGDGKMCVDLTIKETPQTCDGEEDFHSQVIASAIILDSSILLFSLVSIFLALSRLQCANTLRKDIIAYFEKERQEKQEQKDHIEKEQEHKQLTFCEQFGLFCDMWDVLVIILSTLAIAGITIKLILENKRGTRSLEWFDNCAIILGTASFLSWISMVRYMNMNKDCNILIETIKIAVFPRIFYFVVCVAFLFIGFTFCGWLVLGPYNIKYRDYSTTSQTLFALANGDDIYKTFSNVDSRRTIMWTYNQIFLYIYVAVFIIVVLNVAIAIINDAYEEIKEIYKKKDKGLPVSKIDEFLLGEPKLEKDDIPMNESFFCRNIFCCCQKRENAEVVEVIANARVQKHGQRPTEYSRVPPCGHSSYVGTPP